MTEQNNGKPDKKTKFELPSLKKEIEEAVKNDDPAGLDEAKLLGSGKTEDELRKVALTAEHGRREKFRDHFECVAIFALYAATAGVTVMAIVLLADIIFPHAWTDDWLSKDQVSDLRSFLTGGVLVGIITSHLKKRL